MSDTPNDHDLLIELRTEMRGVRTDIKTLSDTTASRLTIVEQTKLDKTEAERLYQEHLVRHDDYEKRLRFLERYVWGAIALIAAAELAIQYFWHG